MIMHTVHTVHFQETIPRAARMASWQPQQQENRVEDIDTRAAGNRSGLKAPTLMIPSA